MNLTDLLAKLSSRSPRMANGSRTKCQTATTSNNQNDSSSLQPHLLSGSSTPGWLASSSVSSMVDQSFSLLLLGLGVSDSTPAPLWGPYFLRRVPVNDFNLAASAAFSGSKRNGCFENFSTKWIKRVTLRGEITTSRSLLTIIPSGCMLIGTGLTSAGINGLAGGFK